MHRLATRNYSTFPFSINGDDANGTVAGAKIHGTHYHRESELRFQFTLLAGLALEASV